jgi:phage shock protein PspC (stress-responsive transcriptional regulator)
MERLTRWRSLVAQLKLGLLLTIAVYLHVRGTVIRLLPVVLFYLSVLIFYVHS